MMTNLTVFSSNCQRCASGKFLKVFHEYIAEYKPDIVCLLEPRISGKNANFVIEKLGFNFFHRVETTGFLGGIWVGWKDIVNILILYNHPQFILLRASGMNPLLLSILFLFMVVRLR